MTETLEERVLEVNAFDGSFIFLIADTALAVIESCDSCSLIAKRGRAANSGNGSMNWSDTGAASFTPAGGSARAIDVGASVR